MSDTIGLISKGFIFMLMSKQDVEENNLEAKMTKQCKMNDLNLKYNKSISCPAGTPTHKDVVIINVKLPNIYIYHSVGMFQHFRSQVFSTLLNV